MQRQKEMNSHVKKTLKQFDHKRGAGQKRSHEESNFDKNLMPDTKRAKHEDDQADAPVDNKQIADSLSKLSSALERIEANKDVKI